MEPLEQPGQPAQHSHTGRGRLVVLIACAAALVLITAGVTYAVAGSKTTTKVRTVAAQPATTTAPKCIPGAAAGSCNIDEASEINLTDQPLSTATRTTLAKELVEARAAALKYPTVADAQKAGMVLAGQFSPLTGAHYLSFGGVMGKFDPNRPGSLIYDGTDPTSKVIGTMYLSLSVTPPDGFAGPNDHWHRHTNTCVEYKGGKILVPFAADSDVTRAMCDAKHGVFMRETAWMVHAWVVPGWDSPRGVFAHDNPDVVCADGTTHADAEGFCQGT
jgi:hypothetical protein